jgi:hypothetical protein
MQSDVLNLLTTIATAKARNENIVGLIEAWAADHDLDLAQLGRRARRSFSNRLEAAAVALSQTIARAANVVSEAPSSKEIKDFKWQND